MSFSFGSAIHDRDGYGICVCDPTQVDGVHSLLCWKIKVRGMTHESKNTRIQSPKEPGKEGLMESLLVEWSYWKRFHTQLREPTENQIGFPCGSDSQTQVECLLLPFLTCGLACAPLPFKFQMPTTFLIYRWLTLWNVNH